MLEIKNLCFSINNHQIINCINFCIKENEIIGMIGPNGAGKTTCLRLLAGILTPNDGEIIYDGIKLSQSLKQAQKNIGYLQEGAPLYNDMTPREFLEFIGQMHGFKGTELKEKVAKVALIANIKDVFHQIIETLSKGFKRRVAFAAATLHEPKFLILDEPMDGLDPNQKKISKQNIKKIASNRSIIISTHNFDEIQDICTRIILINQGEIIIDEQCDKFLKRIGGNFENAFSKLTQMEN